MEYYAKSATKSLSDDEKSEIVKKIKSAIEIVEDNLTQSEKTAIDNSIDEFINIYTYDDKVFKFICTLDVINNKILKIFKFF